MTRTKARPAPEPLAGAYECICRQGHYHLLVRENVWCAADGFPIDPDRVHVLWEGGRVAMAWTEHCDHDRRRFLSKNVNVTDAVIGREAYQLVMVVRLGGTPRRHA